MIQPNFVEIATTILLLSDISEKRPESNEAVRVSLVVLLPKIKQNLLMHRSLKLRRKQIHTYD
jgi:hypothetical protein